MPPINAESSSARREWRLFGWLLFASGTYMLLAQAKAKTFPLFAKASGASNLQLATIIGVSAVVAQIAVTPLVGYFSDRTTSRWGRRIPYLIAATPLMIGFFVVLPIVQIFSGPALSFEDSWGGAVLIIAFAGVIFNAASSAFSLALFGLCRDTVSTVRIGRFMSLYRIIASGAAFVATYVILGIPLPETLPMFGTLALMQGIAICALAFHIRNAGPSRPASAVAPETPALTLAHRVRKFCQQGYGPRIYRWMHVTRGFVYGAMAISAFIIFFPLRELDMEIERVGQMMSWASLIWMFLAYPIGRLIDAKGPLPILSWTLFLSSAGYALSFLLVRGETSFLISTVLVGLAFLCVRMGLAVLTQKIFAGECWGQLVSASIILQALATMLIFSPLTGGVIDGLEVLRSHQQVFRVAGVELEPYRSVNLILALMYLCAWIGVRRVNEHWLRLGGAAHYVAPQ